MGFSPQALQSQFHQLLPQSNNNPENKTIQTRFLKLVGNTLVFNNTIYQIRNMSSAELADLTEIYAINTKVPAWYWFLLALGVILLFAYGIGIFILIFVGWLFWQHSQLEKSKTVEKYGLKIVMNSGESIILTSRSKEFVLKIILSLYGALNDVESKASIFNFETLQIEDRSIKIDKSYGSAVISGVVGGDVVNNLGI